jgi:serine/threonine protein kinase/Tfp pilus assembly protein PilF
VVTIGALIGPYRLVAPLGRGAMGEVWRAKDERLDRYVALKVLSSEVAADTERRARMLREARAAAAVKHVGVVTLFDIVEHEGEDILVMELVEGRTLADILRNDGPPVLERALRWIEEIADALAAAHARGILHRDLKSANVMVTNDGFIKVLDFGLAKMLSSRDVRDVSASQSTQMRAAHDAAKKRMSLQRAALDETMPSGGSTGGTTAAEPVTAVPNEITTSAQVSASRRASLATYQTDAGSLLGTPMYLSPEQVNSSEPDERSEVFSIGVLSYEIINGKPPYNAQTVEDLFQQITDVQAPPMAGVSAVVNHVVQTALAKPRDQRFASMRVYRDAVIAARRRLFAPRNHKMPLIAALFALLLVTGGTFSWWWTNRPIELRAGDSHVQRALEEYDVFFGEKALSSLRTALTDAPMHPRALAYMILFGGAPDTDRDAAVVSAEAIVSSIAANSKDRALLNTSIALVRKGPIVAYEVLADNAIPHDRELRFWSAEMAMRSGNYAAANVEYASLLTDNVSQFRGRIYDHYSAVLLYFDKPADALRIGKLYRDAYPGEADAVGVYATTLAAAGKFAEAQTAAEDAIRLNEGEDTLAGLGKVFALKGDFARAKELYRKSMERARDARRPIRRAALALLLWMDGDSTTAASIVAPCLSGGADATIRQRGACLFVAGLINRDTAESIAQQLEELASDSTPAAPAYGDPQVLADLLRAYQVFSGGGCLQPAAAHAATSLDPPTRAMLRRVYDAPFDFYASYHVPMMASWQACESAALDKSTGDTAAAGTRLSAIINRAPGRFWVERQLGQR